MEPRHLQPNQHDIHLVEGMVTILMKSLLNEEDYGFREMGAMAKKSHQTRYKDVAKVLTQEGFKNQKGNPINADCLKKTVKRIQKDKSTLESLKPDWTLIGNRTSNSLVFPYPEMRQKE